MGNVFLKVKVHLVPNDYLINVFAMVHKNNNDDDFLVSNLANGAIIPNSIAPVFP